jgi:hypothetical protein
MERVSECGCGLDAHAKTVVACLLKQAQKERRPFSPMTADLLRWAAWVVQAGCTHGAIESTGVYVRRITARAISLAEGTGSEGNPWVNDSPGGESQGGQ